MSRSARTPGVECIMAKNVIRRWGLSSALALTLALVTATFSTGAGTATGALAQGADGQAGPTWTQTSLTEPTSQLFTPTSGALFARTASGLARSDDAGQSWRAVNLPAAPVAGKHSVLVDPTNHTTIYLTATDGIYKTEDDAAHWRMILPAIASTPENPSATDFRALAVSPADPHVLYATFTSPVTNELRFQRSADGGQTWETLPNVAALPPGAIPQKCTWAVTLVQPHLTDPNRLFRAAACNIRGDEVPLKQTRDGGQTFGDAIYKYPLGQVMLLAGGQPDAPQRLYAGVNKDYRGGGSLLARSDDDGASWRTLLEYTGGGGMSGGGPDVSLTGLALDPTNSDRLLVGLNATLNDRPFSSTLRLSLDGGSTWADASPEGIGKLADVAFGVDGRLLFTAGETGVWRAAMP